MSGGEKEFISIAMDTIEKQREEIFRLENTIKYMKSEIRYSLDSNKLDEAKRRYLENCIRFADEVIYVK